MNIIVWISVWYINNGLKFAEIFENIDLFLLIERAIIIFK